MLLFFNRDKADFERIDYNSKLWDQTFAASNPPIQEAKGKHNASMQIAAVDMKPSSETKINEATLLYQIYFRGGKSKLKKGDFSFLFLSQDLPEINYANYEGISFPVTICDFPDENRQAEESEVPFSIAPNPACGEVQIAFNEPLSETTICTIFDLQGNEIFQQLIDKSSRSSLLMINTLSQGLYFINIQSSSNQWTRKLVVSRCSKNTSATDIIPRISSNSTND
ncbi:MAG: T9SS type A sorting domain-containing protein [Bacteroidota bacterium]